MLEDAVVTDGAIDLDWLMWFDVDICDDDRQRVFLANLTSVVGNYVDAGAERFLLAGAIPDSSTLDAIRGAIPLSLRIFRLSVPLQEIEIRLGTAVTIGRERDLQNAKTWITESKGIDIEDITISNARAIQETAQEVHNWLDW